MFIIEKASDVLNLHWNGYLPVNPTLMANRLGVTGVADESLSAQQIGTRAYFDANRKPVIRVNTTLCELAQRYSIARALGHLTLRHAYPGSAPINVAITLGDSHAEKRAD